MNDILIDLGQYAAWIGVSLPLLALSYAVVDLLTPGNLRVQVSESINAAILVMSRLVAAGIVVLGAILQSDDVLATGIVQTVTASLVGIVAAVVVFVIVDVVLPADVRNLVNEEKFDPAVLVSAGADIAAALVIAGAIS